MATLSEVYLHKLAVEVMKLDHGGEQERCGKYDLQDQLGGVSLREQAQILQPASSDV